MPLIINKRTIEKINGPFNLTLLRPIENSEIFSNYFMLFGDIHSTEGYEDIDSKMRNTLEFYPIFINELNEFGAKNTVEFYIEDFFNNKSELSLYILQDVMNDIRRDPKNANHYIIEFKNEVDRIQGEYIHKDPRIATKIKESYRIALINLKTYLNKSQLEFLLKIDNAKPNTRSSNLLEMTKIYLDCFLKEKTCKLKNIKWQYSDIRKSLSYYLSKKQTQHIYSYEGLSTFSSIISKTFISIRTYSNITEFTDENIKKINDDIFDESTMLESGIYNSVNKDEFIKSLYDFTIIMLTDENKFSEGILNSYKIKKQYDKLSPASKLIFTKESLIELIRFINMNIYIRYSVEVTNRFVEILQKIKNYLYDYSSDELIKNDILNWLNLPENIAYFNDEDNLKNFQDICIMSVNSLFDFYFILRSYTSVRPMRNNKKLVSSYSGIAHGDATVHYLTNIVKTHTIDFKKDDGETRRLISFDREINLDLFFNSEDIDFLYETAFGTRRSRHSRHSRHSRRSIRPRRNSQIRLTQRRY